MSFLDDMAKKFHAAASRGEELGLSEDEIRLYDALADNKSAVRELTDETFKKIAHELTENLRKNLTVDQSVRESVRAKLRIMGVDGGSVSLATHSGSEFVYLSTFNWILGVSGANDWKSKGPKPGRAVTQSPALGFSAARRPCLPLTASEWSGADRNR